MPLWMLWKGILLGLGAAAPIGPVNVEIARRSLRGGFFAGFSLGLGAVTVDATYLIFAALSIRLFLDQPLAILLIGLSGTLLLAYLGINCLRSAARLLRTPPPHVHSQATLPIDPTPTGTPQQQNASPPPPTPNRNYLTGLAMTATNPMTLAFWFVVIPAIGPISSQPGRDLPFVCAGVCIGALSWVCFFASLTSLAGRFAKQTTMVLADLLGGLMLLGFAASTLVALYAKCRTYL